MHHLSTVSPFLILVLLINSWPLLLSSAASDSLASGQSLKEGQTLISASQIFELGFFSPGNSSYRYVGIWYYNISEQTVVWVANREKPVEGSGGNLTVAANGNLELLNGSGDILWSTNISTSSNGSTVKLQDSGNLLLQAGDGTDLWQSFHDLSNTFLPGMILTLNMKNGRDQRLLTSWQSPVDPAVGKYSLGLDPSGSAQVFIWEGLRPWWRSGQWNGKTFIGTTMRSLNIYGFNLVVDNNQGTMSLTFTPANSSLLRFELQTDGVERTSMLVGETKEWRSVWVQPSNDCEYYGTCGTFSTCSNISTSATCSCLQGFEPASRDEWSRGNWTRGCVRRTPLECELNGNKSTANGSIRTGDGFYRLGGVKLPDLSEWASVASDPSGCENHCMNNCSCKAYSYVDSIGCLVWGRYLIDIYQLPQGGNDLYIKLPRSELGGSGGGKSAWIIIAVCSILGVGLVMICIYMLWRCRARIKDWWKKNEVQETLFSSLRFSRDMLQEFSGPSEPGEVGEDGKLAELPLFTLDFMALATNDFSDSNKLGEGGFGLVYKGILPGGGEVAIKRLSRSSGQGLEEFKNEVLLIAKLQHRNLVRLLGCCIEGDEKMLIYEYMPNKSLDVLLFDPMKQGMLDWNKRFNIIEGIARGLVYLHRDSRLRIVHRDLKASNILLDEELNPKISDFGMARIFGGDQNEANTNRLVGTYGYMSPEYAMEGLFSVKSDVYSFGVLVLEIVTGRKNNSFHYLEDAPNLTGYVWPLWNEGRALDLVDPSIRNSCSARQALRCIHVALLCVQDRANDRPDMSSVVVMLESDGAILHMPRRPTFVSDTGPAATETCSANDLSITILSAR